LEAFTACPFKFLLQQVLRLEPLEEPAETIETTRRGSAYHRALARLHRQFRAAQQAPGATALVPAQTAEQLAVELSRAVEEYAARAPSAAARVLWQIEAERLRRSASKYAQHWAAFVAPWAAAEAWPQPTFLEADFGLPSTAGSAPLPALVVDSPAGPVRIGGRIDRVDVAELPDGVGFWVIDYKTGRASNYSATDVQELRKLQLPLYALALERVFFADRPSRPLGVAYWLVTDTGPKIVLPGGRTPVLWLTDPQRWPAFRQRLEAFVGAVVEQIRAGTFPLAPQSDHCTASCPYGPVCRIGAGQPAEKRWRVPLPIVPKEAA
jgi:ATP-dependent helicase/nuclease subunit B